MAYEKETQPPGQAYLKSPPKRGMTGGAVADSPSPTRTGAQPTAQRWCTHGLCAVDGGSANEVAPAGFEPEPVTLRESLTESFDGCSLNILLGRVRVNPPCAQPQTGHAGRGAHRREGREVSRGERVRRCAQTNTRPQTT